MTDKQPEALRLADFFETDSSSTFAEFRAATELRRLHDENDTLKKCLFQMQNAAIELAKPEQEPKLSDAGADTNISRGLEPKGSGWVTLNQVGMRVDLNDAPPRKPWVGLTDEEKTEIFMQAEFNDLTERQMYDVVEAKLKDKNDTL
jgi:hypothetical protein